MAERISRDSAGSKSELFGIMTTINFAQEVTLMGGLLTIPPGGIYCGYMKYMDDKNKGRIVRRLKLLEGQIRGLQKMVENDTLNILFHSGKYKTKILDAVDTNLYYGPASQYNTLNRKPPKSIERYGYYFCESWLDIKLVNNKPMLNNKYIKVLHQCHGGGPPKLQYELFSDEFLPYVKKITQCDF